MYKMLDVIICYDIHLHAKTLNTDELSSKKYCVILLSICFNGVFSEDSTIMEENKFLNKMCGDQSTK